ncbi:glycosyltransferase family 4 protein [Pseudomonas sp. KCJK8927]|uniref:glycosyltransferase family 4 protein n=1 Tax=Pseudomonas sp. KCJK8927 TaxID=3344560 RepID=UPI003906459F
MKFLVIASFPESLLGFRGPLLERIKKQGYTVHVAAPNLPVGSDLCGSIEAQGLVVHNIPLRRTGLNPISDFLSFLALWRLMWTLKPDAMLAYTIKPVIYGLLAARLAGVSKRYALITGLGYAFQGAGDSGSARKILRGLVQKLYALALRGARKTFFQNPDDLALFRSRNLLRSSSGAVVVNGSGVDLENFVVSEPATPVSFLLIARLLGDKGVREYVGAARLIRKEYPLVIFNLVGWIDENPDAIRQDELDSWLSEGIVSYWGRLSDVRPAIESSSVYVLPSYREGTPRTVLEAMAMGRPIITTDAPGCRETVVNGLNGFLVEVKNVTMLANAMRHFIDCPESLKVMGKASRRLAEEKYDVHAVNEVMLREMEL